jgi:hypothetical protein
MLGPFQEQFRQYLLGLLPFPKDCSSSVVVREGKEIDRLTYAPLGKREENFHVYKFPMPAIGFSIVVSKNIPRNYREKCFVHGHGNPIVVTTRSRGVRRDSPLVEAQRLYRHHSSIHPCGV